MAIEISKKITEKDACSILLKEKQELLVVNVSEIKKSTKEKAKENQYIDKSNENNEINENNE